MKQWSIEYKDGGYTAWIELPGTDPEHAKQLFRRLYPYATISAVSTVEEIEARQSHSQLNSGVLRR